MRAADLQAQLEPRIADAQARKDLSEEHMIMVAEIREILGVADEDSRPLVEIVGATVHSLKEQTARADGAQEGLHRVLGDLAAANDRVAALKAKSSERRKALAQAFEYIEAQEIKLAEANAEIDLRRSRAFRPEPREVEQWRAAGAQDARRMQEERKTQSTSE